MARITCCPFCFSKIDSSNLAYQCTERGEVACIKLVNAQSTQLTGRALLTGPTFTASPGRTALCPQCGGEAKRRACPRCHSSLPIDFADSSSPLIGLAGSKGSGKTVLLTVLVKQLREVTARRFSAEIRIAADNPDGHLDLNDYYASREVPLFKQGLLPLSTAPLAQRRYAAPVVLRWRQETGGRTGGSLRSSILSLIDSAGEDMGTMTSIDTLGYLSACESLIVTIDPFTLPGARAQINLPPEARTVDDEATIDALGNVTTFLHNAHKITRNRKIKTPVAIVFTKMDAFYPALDAGNPITSPTPATAAYDESDGQIVHENMRALLREWGGDLLDRLLRANYEEYRYFAVSALGAEPDYTHGQLVPGGVRPHRIEDPLLWLLSKTGTVASQH